MSIVKIAAGAVASLAFAAPAVAGPYVNLETNSGFDGGDYGSTRIDTQVGYTDALGEDAKWYVQAGPSILTTDDADTEQQFGGKLGVKANLTEEIAAYGEVKGYTADEYDFTDLKVTVKAGLVYSF